MNYDLEELEIDLLLEGIYRYYGLDLRDYARASMKRRIANILSKEQLKTISALQEQVLHDRACMQRFLLNLSVHVTSMFRDASFYLAFRQRVIPILKTYPFIRIWHAGCASGEEVYSFAILLQEEGIYQRCRLYGTDINEMLLQQAKAGIFSLDRMQEYTQNYLKAGGKKGFSEYYTAAYENAIFNADLKKNLIFAPHNLVTDNSFNDFHVIICRNVMIYFNQNLQARVHKLFYESLVRFGILGLGRQESIKFTPYQEGYDLLESSAKIYQRIN